MTSWLRGGLAACVVAGLSLPVSALETGAVPPAPLAPDSVEARLESLISTPGLVAAEKKFAADKEDVAGTKAFYAARQYAPLWVNERGLTAQAEKAVAEMSRADDWGLKSADFALPTLKPGMAAGSRDALADRKSVV